MLVFFRSVDWTQGELFQKGLKALTISEKENREKFFS